VARHSESLSWLRKVPSSFRITVYDKGAHAQSGPSIVPELRAQKQGARAQEQARACVLALPNMGREAHTYLHHIASRLASPHEPLACITVFCQGRPFDHAFDFHHTLRALAENAGSLSEENSEENQEKWRWLGHIIDTDTREGALFQAWSKNTEGHCLDMDGFHQSVLGWCGPAEYVFVPGGQFLARRELLEARGLRFWERALEVSKQWPHAAHCFERSWDKVLGAPGPALMPGQRTAYMKRIRPKE